MLITRFNIAEFVATKWKKQYKEYIGTDRVTAHDIKPDEVYRQLINMTGPIERADLLEVLPNDSWLNNLECGACLKYKPTVLLLKNDAICSDCMKSWYFKILEKRANEDL